MQQKRNPAPPPSPPNSNAGPEVEPAARGLGGALRASPSYHLASGFSRSVPGSKDPTMNHTTTLRRLKRGVEHLHTLGPRAMAEMLVALAARIAGLPAILALLAEYQHLSPAMIRDAGGDVFPPPALRLVPREVQQ